MDLTELTDEELQDFNDNFPEESCVGLDCDNSCPHYKSKRQDGTFAISCDDVYQYLLPESYRRGIIDKETYDEKMEAGYGG